jgi:hypothetical protein
LATVLLSAALERRHQRRPQLGQGARAVKSSHLSLLPSHLPVVSTTPCLPLSSVERWVVASGSRRRSTCALRAIDLGGGRRRSHVAASQPIVAASRSLWIRRRSPRPCLRAAARQAGLHLCAPLRSARRARVPSGACGRWPVQVAHHERVQLPAHSSCAQHQP